MKKFKPNADEVIERLILYHRFEDTGWPILNIEIPSKSLPDHIITSATITYLDDFPKIIEVYKKYFQERRSINDDTLPIIWPNMGTAMMAAFMGCPIKFDHISYTSWAQEPILDDWSKLDDIHFDPENKWFKKCLEMIDFLREKAGEDLAVSLPDVSPGAPADLAAAIRGRERFLVDLFRHPEEAKELMGICLDAYFEIVDYLNKRISHPYGGTTVGWLFHWMPGVNSTITQEDIAVCLSPEMYRRLVKPFDEQLMYHYENTIFHCDGAWQIVPDLQKIEKLSVLQLSESLGVPPPSDIPDLQGQERKKPIEINCSNINEIKHSIEVFGCKGLKIHIGAGSVKAANKLVEEVKSFSQKF